jgi:hypothetical protein
MPPSPSSTGVKGEPPRSLGRCHCRSTERLSAWHVGFQGASLAAHQSEIKVEDDERGQEECWLMKHPSSAVLALGIHKSARAPAALPPLYAHAPHNHPFPKPHTHTPHHPRCEYSVVAFGVRVL